ncbi:Type II/IV secretion system protein [Poriferisphaera corsica]|uniref:Type II/IV secretion system protein n=1 Tax=Poriferisphaera corsica TaxID=2528020 RepID=A0A517YUL8_9BACT|nr:ATPase, T2SS/T4P/T4SS family [Poriferisphaera corsica]QDU33918.1 Type II/IV secretion system protein [Poriferisphaera corsica]
MARKRRQIGEILKRWGLVDDQQIEEAAKIAQGSRKRIGDVLNELGYAQQNDVAKALASQFDMEFVDLDQPNVVSKDNLSLIPIDMIKKYIVLPLGKDGDTLKVLVHDPMDLDLIDDLQFRLGGKVELALGAKAKIKEYIDSMLSETRESIDQTVRELSMDQSMDRGASLDIQFTGDDSQDEDEDDGGDDDTPIIKLVNQVIAEAVLARSSDIHIEPFENRVRLRYRIDGVCHERNVIPKRVQSAVTARMKILAGMKVEERRIPQDGRIKMKIAGDPIDFRVSCCPVYHGESIVLRVLRPDAANIGLDQLGMQPDTLEIFNDIITRPTGIFLVTGPTGSGKTTTLYSALAKLNRPDLKIITAEDPIEYNFKGINQCQVSEATGMTFQIILKAMLRQAPNIILVGEIRDKEVGEVAVQAALTGHLVFSTLHTNDAPSAITRMLDMGLKPFLVASSVQAILAQRLIRMLCQHCKEPDENPDERMMALCGFSKDDLAGKTVYKACGCKRCSGTGYRGRRGIYEILVMNSEIRDLAFNREPVSKIREAAALSGMRNLLGDGKLKILSGETTLEEISRITQVEGLVDDEIHEDEDAIVA